MPKKTRKMKERAAMRRSAAAQTTAPGMEFSPVPEEPAVRMRPAFVPQRPSMIQEYNYSYIYGDLKRIALFASFFFGVLIVLSFVIK